MNKIKSQKQGEDFENAFCDFLKIFLKECFDLEIFITEPIRQNSGEQHGRDITARWEYEKNDFNWWFECKSHLLKGIIEGRIHRKELADKIIEVLVNKNRPSCYCIVSANKEQDNWLRDKIPLINEVIGYSQIIWWSPKELALKKCIALYPEIWRRIYGEEEISTEYLTNSGQGKNDLFMIIREKFKEINMSSTKEIQTIKKNYQKRDKVLTKTNILNDDQFQEVESTIKQINLLNKIL